MAEQTSQKIKVGSVTIHVYQWIKTGSPKPYWRAVYHDPETGKRKYITRADKRDLVKEARKAARTIHNGTEDLSLLTPEQVRLCRAFLELKPDWNLIERLKAEQSLGSITTREAFESFIEAKQANAGASPRNVATLKNRVGHLVKEFGKTAIADIVVSDLNKWLNSGTWEAGTKTRIRASVVTFFRWCRSQGYLPDRTTNAEKMDKPIVHRKAPSTLTPKELAEILLVVSPQFRPWLVLSAWAGIRREEMYPSPKSKKDVLRWEDIDLNRKIIIIRREVSKTNERRVIPICAPLLAELTKIHAKTGRVTEAKTPTDSKNGVPSETSKLGSLIGGWKPNVLRHSFLSYRCAQVGVGKAAMEAGNSEAETRRSYRDAKSEEEAELWFSAEPLRNPKTRKSKTP